MQASAIFRRVSTIACVLIGFTSGCVSAASSTPPSEGGLLTSLSERDLVRDRIRRGDPRTTRSLDAHIKLAEEQLEVPIRPITAGKESGQRVAPSGDPHDYVSLSPYWWPNPDTADGLPYIRRDGQVNPERYDYDTPKLGAVGMAIRMLGIAYHATGDERYAKRVAEHARAWFVDPATRMRPRVQYSQFIPGVSDGRSVGIIDTNRLRWVADALLMVEPSPHWTAEDMAATRQWYGEYLDWLLTSDLGKGERSAENNHGSWFRAQAMQYALFSGNEDVARELALEAIDRIDGQFDPSGFQPHEAGRTRSLHYHDFNLRAYLDIALYAREVGVDVAGYESEKGASVRRGIEFIMPYFVDPEPWTYRQIDEPNQSMYYQTLRAAARLWDDPRYEQAARSLPVPQDTYMWIDLALPSRHDLENGER